MLIKLPALLGLLLIGTALVAQTADQIYVNDTRSVNTPPTGYSRIVKFDFKNNAAINSPSQAGYVGLMSFAPWFSGDVTGEKFHQLGFAQDGLYWRTGVANASGWDPWVKLVTGTTDNHIQMLANKELRFPSASGGFNRISSAGENGNIFGSWIFKSRFDHIVLDAGENGGNERKIIFKTGGTDRMILDSDGNVGVGIAYPLARMHIRDGAFWSSHNFGASLIIDGSHNNAIGIFDAANSNPLAIANSSGTFTIAKMPPLGNTSTPPEQLLTIQPNGNVGIGTTTPGSFKLAVNGKIWTQEVNVAMTNPGPDYVFEKDYNLTPLSELETYITQNKHLPEVPSAKEMEADGLNLKEMNLLLLKKVEELTLHLIEMNNNNQILMSQVKELQIQMSQISKNIKR